MRFFGLQRLYGWAGLPVLQFGKREAGIYE